MTNLRFLVIDPGHFHAALVLKEMHPGVSPVVEVYAPDGPDLADFLDRIRRFNTRADHPTAWQPTVHAGADFLDRMRAAPPGGVAILSGRNRDKIALVRAALTAGHHVLADKPLVIRPKDRPALAAALDEAAARGLVLADLMTGRSDPVTGILRALHADPAVFGRQVEGTPEAPGVAMTSVHHLMKTVAGAPNLRPAWYFDVTEQGDALADIGTHLVDKAHEILFPDAPPDAERDLRVVALCRWPTMVSAAQFRAVTAVEPWPEPLRRWVSDEVLAYPCNAACTYLVRGVHVGLDLRWDWESAAGDTHSAVFRGSHARLELRPGAGGGTLFVVPEAEPDAVGAALDARVAALQGVYPGLAVAADDGAWRVIVPPALQAGHDERFIRFTRQFLDRVRSGRPLPDRERAAMLARYAVCSPSTPMAA